MIVIRFTDKHSGNHVYFGGYSEAEIDADIAKNFTPSNQWALANRAVVDAAQVERMGFRFFDDAVEVCQTSRSGRIGQAYLIGHARDGKPWGMFEGNRNG
jgi:hypothetical protein